MIRISTSARRLLRRFHIDVTTAVTLVIFIAAIALILMRLFVPLKDIYEDASFTLFPSAQKAFDVAEVHFRGENSSEYDIRRAKQYFDKAFERDPSLTYLHHEIARIFFLQGDLVDAKMQIDIQIKEHGTSTPNSYYVRGLIEGYAGEYGASAKDYEAFLKSDPHNWAAINDYAWVLLKAGRAKDAKVATDEGMKYWPNNPWLLNSNAIARYELGDFQGAKEKADAAWIQVQKVSNKEWLHSYPGNDPAVANEGIETFKNSVQTNIHKINLALASSTVQ